MPIAAHFEPTVHSDDPRHTVRHTLHLQATGATASGENARVTVHNISCSGLLLETVASLEIGETLVLDLPDAGGRRATVGWASSDFYGCQFETPLTSAELSAAQLRSGSLPQTNGPRSALVGIGDDFGHRLQRLRKQRGLTLAQVAERLGVSKPTVWAWEQGRSRPVGNRIDPLAEALGVNRVDLYPDADGQALLQDLLIRVRTEVAAAAGASPDKIRISIEL